MKKPVLTFESVRRTFGRKVALESLDLVVEPGTVLGLVGRNGAGKTTALRLALGVLHPDSGSLRTLGLDPAVDGESVRSRVGLLSEETALYPWMTVREILDFAGALHPRWDEELARSLSGRLDLDPSERIGGLSRGTRAKVALVLAVAPRPELLLLDDPTSGLDPLVRREVLEEILRAVPEEGGAVVYASHLVHDVERVADRVAVLVDGRLVLDDTVEALKGRVRRFEAVFEAGAPSDPVVGALDASAEGRLLSGVVDGTNGDVEAALRRLGAREVRLEAIPLEEILVALFRRHAPGRERSGD